MQLTIIAAIVVAIAGVAFALQNNVPVTVNFLIWRFDSSLAMVLLLAVALGAVVVALITTPGTIRRQWSLGRLQRRIDDLEVERARLKDRVVALEKALPERLSEEPAAPAYVGLAQIASSLGDRSDGGKK